MIVYTHTRCDTNVIFYVGISKTEKRAYNKRERSKHWKYIVNKAGYSVEIIHKCETWVEACYTERYLIAYYGRKDLGLGELCNMTSGGEGTIGRVISEEHRAKLSAAQKGRKYSDETRSKMSSSMKGIIFTEEHCAKLSVSLKNNPILKEHLAKLHVSNKGRVVSAETRSKISAARKRYLDQKNI